VDKRLLEVRKRLATDFEFYAANALKIRTDDGQIVPFVLNKTQKRLLEIINAQLRTRGYIRIVTLKARQMGLSTFIEAYAYFVTSQNKGRKALVLTHKAESTDALFGMTKRLHDLCPDALKPSTKYLNKRELTFDKLDSQFTVGTAGGTGVARGETNTFIHASELGFWTSSSARDTWNGIRQSVADKPGTAIFIESTANGIGNAFYDLVQGALKGDSDYELAFFPWHWDEDYQTNVPLEFERSPEEEELVAAFDLTDRQLAWRRKMIAEVGRDLFKQEYPITVDEAFLASGRPVFDPETVHALLGKARSAKPPKVYSLSPSEVWEEDKRGELVVYEEPDPKRVYVVGGDVSGGTKGGDYSVGVVIDDQRRVVAKWRGHVLTDFFATILYKLGEWYNMAEIIPENNNHGQVTCNYLAKILDYPYLFTTVSHSKMSDEFSEVIGFTTNVKTRPMILDMLRSSVKSGTIHIPDVDTLLEMQTFIVNESGKLEAENGKHDDCVIALALANYRAQDLPAPVKMDDSWYRETF
jgi:hypothetical protein